MRKNWLLPALVLCLTAFDAISAIRITPAIGGEAISADTAANGIAPSWTTLGPIILKEKNYGHRNRFAPGTNVTLNLRAPAGFEFNPAVPPSVIASTKPNATSDISAASASITSSNILTITLTVTGENIDDTLEIGGTTGLQVRPTFASPLASGNIHRPSGSAGGSAIIRGLKSTSNLDGSGFQVSNFGSLAEVASTTLTLSLHVPPSGRAVAGAPFGQQPVLAIADAYGNVRTNENGKTISASLYTGPGNLIGTTNVSVVNGLAKYSNLGADTAGTITIRFATTGLNEVVTQPIVVDDPRTPEVATSLRIHTQPSNLSTAGVVFAQQPVISVIDQYDLVMTNENSILITASRSAGVGELQGAVTIPVVNGVATFSNLSHNVANAITLLFTAGDLNPAVSQVVNVYPGPADRLAFSTQPGDAVVGSPFGTQPVVVTEDAFGNESTMGIGLNLSVTVSLTSGTGTLLGTTTQDIGTDEGNGAIIFSDLRIDSAGTNKQLTATATGLLAGTSALFRVHGSPQTITFDALPDKTFGDDPFTVSATASSGLPVSFSIAEGNATISGDTITILGTGTVTVRASQEGNIDYDPAPFVDRSFNVEKKNQTITFEDLPDKTAADAPFALNATASSGLGVDFAIISGPATLSGNILSITGTGVVIVRAAQTGNENYNAAPDVDQSFTVNKADQTITFGTLANKVFGDAAFEVNATASSGLPVSFAILSGPATLSGNTISITGAGTVTVRASQSGDGNFNEAPAVDQSFTINKADQTITFDSFAEKTYGDSSFEVHATASSDLPVSFAILSGPATISGNSITITGAGTVTVRASQEGNANYNPADVVDQVLTINKASQTITFGELPDRSVSDGSFTVSASASSGLTVVFSIVSGPATLDGNTITITGSGTVVVKASQNGDSNYQAAPDVDRSFSVGKLSQSITFDVSATKTYGDGPFTLALTASSGLEVLFDIVSGPAVLTNNTLTLLEVGTVVIRASQPGNDIYEAAPDVERTFDVVPASLVVTAHNASRMFNTANPVFTGTISGLKNGDNITANYSTAATLSSAPGTYPITITLNDPDSRLANYNATLQPGTLTVTPYPLPELLNGPSDITKHQGENVNLTVQATGFEMGYQWCLNGNPIAGATGSSFHVNHARVNHSGEYVCVISNSSGSITSSIAKVEIYLIPCDFDENGQADIVFQNSDGRLAIWYMAGTDYQSSALLRGGKPVPKGWTLVGQNDFNGDGHTDFLFQHENGKLAVWFMEGGNISSSTYLREGRPVPPAWKVVALADFNHDGKTDILFQNTKNSLAVWYMDGVALTAGTLLREGRPVGGGWRVVGARDFNGDRNPDILFQHPDGRLAVWFMNGIAIENHAFLRKGPPATSGWRIVGASDFDRDGDVDLLWQHNTGRIGVWKLDDTEYVGYSSIENGRGVPPPSWFIRGAK